MLPYRCQYAKPPRFIHFVRFLCHSVSLR
jgi:hypothetical protein